jgi:hypothetical protein
MENRFPQVEDSSEPEEQPVEKRRSPFEAFSDWMRYRESEESDDDDEEEDSTTGEKTKRGKISTAFRNLFKKNVEKTTLEGESSEDDRVPEHGLLRGVVEFETPEETALPPPEANPIVIPESQAEEEPDQDNVVEESTPEVPEEPAEVVETTVPENTVDEEDEPEDDTTIILRGARGAGAAGVVPPTGSPAGPTTPGGAGGNVPPPPPSGGGHSPNAAPNHPPQIIHTERETTVIERRGSNGAALAAFIGAEYLSRRRDRKQKERLTDLEDNEKKAKKAQETAAEQIARMEQKMRAEQREKRENAKYEQRKVAEPVARVERQPEPQKIERPTPVSEVKREETRPQSVKEVLEARQKPEIAADKKITPLQELIQQEESHQDRTYENEDIFKVVEQMAEQTDESIAHEVFDERRHEIKDRDSSADAAALPKGTTIQSHATQDAGIYAQSTALPSQLDQRAPTNMAPTAPDDDLQPGTLIAIWVALVIGIIAAIILIVF